MNTTLTMKRPVLFARCAGWLLAGGVLAGLTLHAQQPSGFGGTRTSSRSATTYPGATDIGQARITYDAETRSIIVVADEDTAAHITNVVRQLDRPTPQVLINCVFMEATYSKGTDVGVEGIYKNKVSSKKVDVMNGDSKMSTAFDVARLADLASSGGLYSFVGKDLEFYVSALAKAGKTEILSRPSILARNNQEATINIGQRVPLISGVTYDSFGNQRNAITYQDVGIILQVTPFITSEGMVEMIVAPEVSSVSESSVTFATGGTNNTSSASAPIINTRRADTVVVVPDGQTVVIGGLMHNQKVNSEKKVPILGDIPLLGMLFKHKVTEDEKKELLIFMTPYIVSHPGELAARSGAERARTQMSRKGFKPEELERFLEPSLPASAETAPADPAPAKRKVLTSPKMNP